MIKKRSTLACQYWLAKYKFNNLGEFDMKTKLIYSLVIGALMATPYAQATNTTVKQGKNLTSKEQMVKSNDAVKDHVKEQNALLEKVNQGVLDGYKKVVDATKLLSQKGKEKEAIAALQEATGKFDVALAADPALGMVAIDADVSVDALITTPELVKADTKLAIDLLKEHKVQVARTLLEPMKDEMVISHVYLPMATYPAAIKLATKYLVEGKKDEALTTLDTSLSTLVIKKAIVPLALIRVESLLSEAAKLNKDTEKTKAHTLLDAANEQLEIATLLGYTDKRSKAYDDLKDQIKAVKKEINGKNAVEKMYSNIISSVKDLFSSESKADK